MRTTRRTAWVARATAWLTVVSLLPWSTPCFADDDKARAEELFDQGRKKMQEPGGLEEACRILEESYKLYQRGDTLLNLAECHRREGKTASAWAEFDEAIGHGQKVGYTDAMRVARLLRDQLAVKLSTLTVNVPEEMGALEGFAIEVNGKPWPKEKWNKPSNIDPGKVDITAAATAYKKLSVTVVVGSEKDAKSVEIKLEKEPPPPVPVASASASATVPPPVVPPVQPAAKRPVWPWVAGGAGLAFGAAAVVFALDQRSAAKELNDRCGSDRQRCPQGYDFSSARSRELRDFGLFVGLGSVGVAGLALGAYGLGFAKVKPASNATVVFGPGSVQMAGEF